MNYNSFPLNQVFQNLGYAIGQKLQKKTMNTMFEQLADQIEGPYQIAQAALPATQSEVETLNPGPQPTEGPLMSNPAPSTDFISPPVGTPAGESNRYNKTPPGYDQFLNPGILAGILRNPKINPEAKLQGIKMLGEFRKMMSPQQNKLGRLVPSGSGTYQTIDEYGNVVDTGITVPNKNADSLVWMTKGNRKLQVRESQVPGMEAKGYEQGTPIETGGDGAIKSPLPMTDKGWMIAYDPKIGANIAQKEENGRMSRQIYDPSVHGVKQQEGAPSDIGQATESQKNIANQLVNYKIPLPSGFALRSPYWQTVLGIAGDIDPTFDATQYNVRLKARQDFTSGKSAQNIRSINTLIGHLNTLEDKAKGLENGSVQLWNKIANTGLTQTGDPRVVEFNNAANAVESELAAVFKGTGATDQEIKQWRQSLGASQSPEQLKKGIQTAIELMGSRMDALQNQYEVAMGKPKDFRFLSSRSQKILKNLGVDADELDKVENTEKVTGNNQIQKIGRFTVEVQ